MKRIPSDSPDDSIHNDINFTKFLLVSYKNVSKKIEE